MAAGRFAVRSLCQRP